MFKVWLLLIPIIFSLNSVHLQYTTSEQNSSPYEEGFSITTQYIIDDKARNDIDIEYPKICGLNGIKDIVINKLIKDNIYQLVEREENTVNINYALLLYLNYEIKYLSKDFISIAYKGSWGARFNAGRGYSDVTHIINIDVGQSKIINASDVIKNKDGIYNLLAEDKFESIGYEEGILGNYLFSNKHDTTRKDEIKKELEQGKDSSERYLEWYVNDNNFVFAVLGFDRYYEYSISIDEIKEFLYPDFYEKIKAD